MPVISTFFGIVIRMFYREHGVPHFHAEYQGQQATFTFDGEPLAGRLDSRTALRLVESPHWTEEDHVDPIPAVVRAEHLGGFKIHVVFNDGIEGTIDFSDWLSGPVFEPLKDPIYFGCFFVEGGTVAWPNGADIAPETLHERVKSDEAA